MCLITVNSLLFYPSNLLLCCFNYIERFTIISKILVSLFILTMGSFINEMFGLSGLWTDPYDANSFYQKFAYYNFCVVSFWVPHVFFVRFSF